MAPRTVGAIATRPTDNVQGGHWFISVSSGRLLNRRKWTELPMPSDVIQTINAQGMAAGAKPGITFGNDPDDDYHPDDQSIGDFSAADDHVLDDDVKTVDDNELEWLTVDRGQNGFRPIETTAVGTDDADTPRPAQNQFAALADDDNDDDNEESFDRDDSSAESMDDNDDSSTCSSNDEDFNPPDTSDDIDDKSHPDEDTIGSNASTHDNRSGSADAEDDVNDDNMLVDIDDPSVPPKLQREFYRLADNNRQVQLPRDATHAGVTTQSGTTLSSTVDAHGTTMTMMGHPTFPIDLPSWENEYGMAFGHLFTQFPDAKRTAYLW